MNSRSPISAAIFMSGNAARRRSRSSVRSEVFEFPAVGSSIHSSGMPMPFQVTEIIRMLIVVLPKSQLVRSIARTHGLPESPSRSTTTRAASAHRRAGRTGRTGKTAAAPSPSAPRSPHSAASRHRLIVPCCMINSASHDSVSRLVADRSMCLATALDKAFENIDCMSAILRCQAKNRFYESTQRLIQPRRVLSRRGRPAERGFNDLRFDG